VLKTTCYLSVPPTRCVITPPTLGPQNHQNKKVVLGSPNLKKNIGQKKTRYLGIFTAIYRGPTNSIEKTMRFRILGALAYRRKE